MNDTAQAVLDYWKSIGPDGWFRKDDAVDRDIARRFAESHAKAANREFDAWRDEAASCLALVIMLDQFSRNMFRGDPRTFASDPYALELALHAHRKRFEHSVEPQFAFFLHMPFMHSERIADQQRCVALAHAAGHVGELKAAIEHCHIIRRFGRFPHRNKVLGRHTTPAEADFLAAGGFSG